MILLLFENPKFRFLCLVQFRLCVRLLKDQDSENNLGLS